MNELEQWRKDKAGRPVDICTLCEMGDQQQDGIHIGPEGQEAKCGNATSCSACHGDMPIGERCACCGRKNIGVVFDPWWEKL